MSKRKRKKTKPKPNIKSINLTYRIRDGYIIEWIDNKTGNIVLVQQTINGKIKGGCVFDRSDVVDNPCSNQNKKDEIVFSDTTFAIQTRINQDKSLTIFLYCAENFQLRNRESVIAAEWNDILEINVANITFPPDGDVLQLEILV